ncbi:hypothetical protein AAHS21_10235 [Mycobacterium sp. 050272]|uniref:hypothetical protein n=1 Tax=Mycobacterium sp. 050272 TaxID=3142488 RepID=UPI003197D849
MELYGGLPSLFARLLRPYLAEEPMAAKVHRRAPDTRQQLADHDVSFANLVEDGRAVALFAEVQKDAFAGDCVLNETLSISPS